MKRIKIAQKYKLRSIIINVLLKKVLLLGYINMEKYN